MRSLRSIHRVVLLATLVFAVSISAKSETSSEFLTADEAVREALAANRDLQAARFSIDIARGERLQAGRFENPQLQLGFSDDFAFNAEGERSGSIGLSQSFPITSRLARQKDVASKDVAIAQAEIQDFIRRLIAEVQSVFFLVRTRDEQLGVNRRLVASVHAVEDVTARRVKAAEASPAEVGLLRVERMRLEQDAQRLIRERDVAAAALARLLGRQELLERTPIGELDPGNSSTPPAFDRPVQRPDLEAASRGVERAEADRALAHTEVWEDWKIGFGYEGDRQEFDSPIGAKKDSFLSFGLTVPLPLWNRQQGRIATAAAERRRRGRTRDALVLRIEEEVRAAQTRVRTLRLSVDAYANEILPETTRTQELFERGYRQGLMGIAELLQAQRQYNESLAFYVELQGDLRQAAIALEAAMGSSPHLNEPSSPGGNTP